MRRRTERLAELIRRELGRILSGGLGDPRIGFVTLTRVEVSPDLTLAKIYLSVLDIAGEGAHDAARAQQREEAHPRRTGRRV